MGGAAFANAYAQGQPNLRVRRVSPSEYDNFVQIWRMKVQSYFNCPLDQVRSPTPAPGKTSYGDIDILVGAEGDVDWHDLANRTGASAVIKRGPKACSMAVSPNEQAHVSDAVLYIDCQGESNKMSGDLSKEEYIQVDVAVVEPHLLEWTCFADSYSDTAIILGYIISRFGFTQNDKGFWLRLKEIDDSKTVPYLSISERHGMILLTTSPVKLMEFVGLSVERYDQGFDTMDDFYHWLSQCRMLFPHLLNDKDKTTDQIRRERKRPIYADFFFRWLPEHPEACAGNVSITSSRTVADVREDLLQQTLEYFDVKDDYEAAKEEVMKRWHHGHAAYLLRQLLNEVTEKHGDYVSIILRGMRRYVVFVDDEPVLQTQPHADDESQLSSFLDESRQHLQSSDKLRLWLEQNQAELRSLGKSKQKPITIDKSVE